MHAGRRYRFGRGALFFRQRCSLLYRTLLPRIIQRLTMGAQTVYLTEEGMEDIKNELHFLKTKERARIAEEIAEARAHGDLSENAEYDAAKEEQGKLEAKIAKLEDTIAKARLVDEKHIDSSKAFILSKVTIKNKKTDAVQTYTLVSEQEADISQNKISVESPIGKGLLGQEVGDVVDVNVPVGTVSFEILDITR